MLSPNNSSPSSSFSMGSACDVSPNKAPSSSKSSKSCTGDVRACLLSEGVPIGEESSPCLSY